MRETNGLPFSEASIGICGQFLMICAYIAILITFPFSLLVCIKVCTDVVVHI